jgi:hypothetical protein
MNTEINLKLEALRRQLEGSELVEAKDSSFASFLMDAELAFLTGVAQGLKKALGTKLETVKVNRGVSAVYLEVKGEDLSDMSVDLTVSMFHSGGYDAKLFITGTSAMKGGIDVDRHMKIGVLTVELAIKAVMEQFQ